MSNSSVEQRTQTRSSSIRMTNLYKATMNRMFTRKKAKAVKAEPKPELDLSIALPASENFRTSLLMPNLSARFSMLRELDDPSTKIGKAADDSVLAPNRQSRLNDFQSPYGLDDIAEVASIRSSIRPPFAQQNGRATSYASDGGYNTDDDSSHNGSVMSRARPGEGNTLFGGRQKVYKIAGDGLKGRTLYEDDIGVTSFQKYRQGEREREEAERLQELKDIRNGGKGEPYASPVKGPSSLNGSLTRHTSSSTTASAMDSRASTAATSINSQGTPSIPSPPTSALPSNSSQATATAPAPALERSVTKRRLYEQGLDRDIQDQQSQQITRLNSIAKGKGALAGNGRSTPDLFNSRPLQDRPHRPGMNTFQSNSPTPSDTTSPLLNGNSFSTGRNGINANGNNGIHGLAITSSHPASEQSSPVLPPHGEPSALASAINPNDRGKATAMGVFNKPQQFSEQQFLERTKTLRKEREVPLRTHSEGLGGSPKEAQETDGDQMREVRGFTPGPFSASNRSRSTSRGPANRSRSGSTVQKYEPVASAPLPPPVPAEYAGVSAFQRAAMQMKAMNAEASPVTEAAPVEEQLPVQAPLQNRFAFHDDSESDYEQDQSMPSPKPAHPVRLPQIPALPNVQAAIPLVTQHPALREYSDLPEHPAFRSPKLPEIDFPNDATPGATNSEFDFGQPKLNNDYDTESPILGPTSGGLSGMVRQHLRQGSDTSHYSVAQPPAPEVFPSGLQTRNLTNESKSYANNTHAQSGYSHSNAWDLQDYEDYGIDNNSPISPLESTANMSQRDGDRPSHDHNDIRRQLLARTAEPSREIPWQEELRKKSHNRGNSSETQAEKEAFTSEVAARQRAIKEQLKASAESESRSSSPGPGKAGPFGGLGTLRMKTSREPSQVRDTNGKLAKFPGLNGSSTTLNSYTPSPPTSAMSDRPSYDRWRSDRSDRSEQPPRPDLRQRSRSRADTSHSREPMQPFPSYSNGMGTTTSSQSRTGSGRESEERMRSRAESNVNSTRSRSNSEHSASGRSRSRSGRYRDDLAEAMAVGNSSRTTMFPEATPAIPEQYATDFPAQPPVPEHPIPAIPHSLKEGNTLRLQTAITREREHRPLERKMSRENDSRQVDPHVFEQKGLWPPPANAMGVPSPRPSPGYSPVNPGYAHALPQGLSPRPSPGLGSISPALMANSRGSPFAGNPTPPVSATSTPIAPSFPGAGNNPNVLSSSTFGRKPTHRKMSIKKTEISEPRLISTTSVIDTVDLPAGASLMNGMHSVPAVPALNPRRKRFGFGRGDLEAPEPPFVSTQYNSLSADERERQPRSKHRIRKSSSDGAKIGLHIRAQQQGMASMQSIPTLPHKMSPPRPGKAVEGGMF